MGVKKIKVSHKRNDCIGCGSCAMVAPEFWSMNSEDGKADLKGAEWKDDEFMVAEIDEDQIEPNKMAEKSCPVGIIRVEDNN